MTRANEYNGFHAISIDVRDYECDIEGIVNNAVYLNYLEHARHEYLKASGVSFLELHEQGFDPVVVRVEVDYNQFLSSGDSVTVYTKMRMKGRLRFIFDQRIVRKQDSVETNSATVIGTFLQNGRPIAPPPAIVQILAKGGST